MPTAPSHAARVFATPWDGAHGTLIASGRHYGRHWHATHGFGLLEAGAQRSASGRGEVHAQPGDVITTNPGEVHDGRPLDTPSRRWRMLYVEPAALRAMLGTDAPAGDVEFTQPVIADVRLRTALQRLFGRLERWQAAPDAAAVLACDEALVQVCGRLVPSRAEPASHQWQQICAIDPALRRVHERLADGTSAAPSLAELAALAGCSRYQLVRRFGAAFGVPPHAWWLQCRSEHARRSILAGASLAQAAADAGFADQSHLTRLFVRQFGYTPGAWQRAVRPR